MARVETAKRFNLKKILISIWDEFVYGSHLVALGDVFALYALSIILNINVTFSFFIVIYLSIIAINFFNRYKEFDQDLLTNPERSGSVTKWFKFMPYIMGALFLCSVAITAFYAPTKALVFMLILFGLGILYTLLLKGFTRKIIGFKNLMTALPYALLVIFMALFYGSPVIMATYLVTIFYFLRMLINTMFFDIKDIDSDKKEGLRTVAAVYGESNTKKILLFINFLSVTPILLGIYLNLLPIYSIALIVTVFYALLYLNNTNLFKKQTTLYNVVVDGEFILWFPYIFISKALIG